MRFLLGLAAGYWLARLVDAGALLAGSFNVEPNEGGGDG